VHLNTGKGREGKVRKEGRKEGRTKGVRDGMKMKDVMNEQDEKKGGNKASKEGGEINNEKEKRGQFSL
jgi:hypothetical protein